MNFVEAISNYITEQEHVIKTQTETISTFISEQLKDSKHAEEKINNMTNKITYLEEQVRLLRDDPRRSLLFYAPFNEGGGTIVNDLVNNNDLKIGDLDG